MSRERLGKWGRRLALLTAGFVLGWVAAVLDWGSDNGAILGEEAFNTAFQNLISQDVNIRESRMLLVNWVAGPDSTVYFELIPPSAATPVVAWEVITPADRRAIMEMLAVSYDRFRLENNQNPIGENGHFRPIGLKYLGINQPLAVRNATGDIIVYRSPYDRD